jgi:exopolyphosphatase/guanosine-5'-triphosphate,3'-diphosphate pyrophosphatase
VSSTGHHRHSAYLVRNGRLRGFDPDEVELLAAIVRWHRRGDPRAGDDFPTVDEARLRPLCAILRVADGLDRGRAGVVTRIDVQLGPSLVIMRVHSAHDAELELWGARRKRELFEKVFERDLELTLDRDSVVVA